MESKPTETVSKSDDTSDKMLDIDEGGKMPASGSQPSKKYLEAKEKEKKDMMNKVDQEMEKKAAEKKIDHDKVY